MSLHLFYGPMMAGKTQAILNKLTQLSLLGKSCVYISHSVDTREYLSHSPMAIKINFATQKTEKLTSVNVHEYDIIGIDEAQFFDQSLITAVKNFLLAGKTVYVSGLDGSYKQEKFGYILDLIPMADSATKLTAYCVPCSRKGKLEIAPFTRYNGTENDTIIVGGQEVYEPVCRTCFYSV